MPHKRARVDERDELDEELGSITPDEWKVLTPVLEAIRAPVKETLDPESDIAVPAFASAFAMRLRLFHALHDPQEVLTKKAFEYAFKAASEAAGRAAQITDSSTYPGADVLVDQTKYSLKTEAAASISMKYITISKLMESAWTKACDSVEKYFEGLERVVSHLNEYERILVLRTFGRLGKTGSVRYELVEIPRDLLLNVGNALATDFTRLTTAGGTSLRAEVDGTLAFVVVFDGSDQKISIRRLRSDLCHVHGTWTLGKKAQ